MTARIGDWIQTYTGRKFWPLDPRPEDIAVEDIAHALSMKCRFTGHCREFYSVAQHSCLVASLLDEAGADVKTTAWGLLHDAAEAYLPDVARPIKKDLVGFGDLEARVLRAIAQRYGLPPEIPHGVKYFDTVMLLKEKQDVMPPGPDWGWGGDIEVPQDWRITPMTPAEAKQLFLRRFNALARHGGFAL